MADSYSFVILLGFGQYISPKHHCKRETFWIINKVFGGKLSAPPSLFHFLSFSLTFSPFLTSQTPSEDDNSEDEQLKPFFPWRRRLLGNEYVVN